MTDEQAERVIAWLERLTKAVETLAYPSAAKAVGVNATFSTNDPDRAGDPRAKMYPPPPDVDPLTWRMNTGG